LSLQKFVAASRAWLTVVRTNGADAAASTWREVHAGHVPPSTGHVVSMWD
jgi:hypothetical protein